MSLPVLGSHMASDICHLHSSRGGKKRGGSNVSCRGVITLSSHVCVMCITGHQKKQCLPMDLDMARTPKTRAPCHCITLPPAFSILAYSSSLSGCRKMEGGKKTLLSTL